MKKVYEAPVVHLEQFVANEYVAACWKIKCNVPNGIGYYETNGRDGYQRWGDTFIASGYGCGEYHIGVESDNGPEANAMWQESKTGEYYPVFYFSTGRGNNDQHFSKVEDAEWETNPNAS